MAIPSPPAILVFTSDVTFTVAFRVLHNWLGFAAKSEAAMKSRPSPRNSPIEGSKARRASCDSHRCHYRWERDQLCARRDDRSGGYLCRCIGHQRDGALDHEPGHAIPGEFDRTLGSLEGCSDQFVNPLVGCAGGNRQQHECGYALLELKRCQKLTQQKHQS